MGVLIVICHVTIAVTGKGGSVQQEQVKLWKGFLEYERSNPQRLEAAALTQRVELAYMQALMCLLHFPEVNL
jgi:cleavage stimulation factor subunit 3